MNFPTTDTFREPTLNCPNCNHEIRLTESLAAPLIEEARKRFQEQFAKKEAEIEKKAGTLRKEQEELAQAKENLDDEVNARLQTERSQIRATEIKKARDAAAAELRAKAEEAEELRAALAANDLKLGEAQQVQAEIVRKERALEEQKRELELTIEQRVNASVDGIRSKARQEADDAARLKVAEKDQTIESMARTIEELKRKAEQGSQQLQGEVFELELELALRANFPVDTIESVGKGELGGDVIQRITSPIGQANGSLLWETKRTKNWSDSWLAKLRSDQRAAGAEIAILVSSALPKSVEAFGYVDGVWITDFRFALPLAVALRQSLIEIATARQAHAGQNTKMELVYRYLTGPKFRHRVEAIVEKFSEMQSDLDRERKSMARLWAKREAQIRGVIESTVGMYGDLQGIAGKAFQEIDGLELPLLNSSAESVEAD